MMSWAFQVWCQSTKSIISLQIIKRGYSKFAPVLYPKNTSHGVHHDVAMATLLVPGLFNCGLNQVSIALPYYLQRYSSFCVLAPYWNNLWRHQWSHLHNTKSWISLEWDKISQKGKHHLLSLGKAFYISLSCCHLNKENENPDLFLLSTHLLQCTKTKLVLLICISQLCSVLKVEESYKGFSFYF